MPYYRLCISVICILLSGCTNTVGRIELKGKVIDSGTKTTIPGLSVMVEAVHQSSDDNTNLYVGDFTTDDSGRFSYTLNKVRNVSLYNFCIQGNQAYAESNILLGLSDLHRDGKFLSFQVDRIVDFTLKIKRNSNTDFRDTLTVTWKTNGVDGKTFYPYKLENYQINSGTGLIWIGGAVQSEIKTKVFADKNTIVHWQLLRKGKQIHIIDTIFCSRTTVNNAYITY